jgi:3'(2'), 5'-bisphosphate nucleotidase
MMKEHYAPFAQHIKTIAIEAGHLILGYYQQNVVVDIKADDSPVTVADRKANDLIVKKLRSLTPLIPVVSEENDALENQIAAKSSSFWLVDPLDGTKSFIKKQGEFTVNIALIHKGLPVGGVVYVPTTEMCYFVGEDGLAYKQNAQQSPVQISARKLPSLGAVVVASLSHRTEETDLFIDRLPKVHKIISASSSVKFCLVAEGKADVYPRFGRTMEWDTGAGHAVVNAAGGFVEKSDGSALLYGKEGLDNPYFIVFGKRNL